MSNDYPEDAPAVPRVVVIDDSEYEFENLRGAYNHVWMGGGWFDPSVDPTNSAHPWRWFAGDHPVEISDCAVGRRAQAPTRVAVGTWHLPPQHSRDGGFTPISPNSLRAFLLDATHLAKGKRAKV